MSLKAFTKPVQRYYYDVVVSMKVHSQKLVHSDRLDDFVYMPSVEPMIVHKRVKATDPTDAGSRALGMIRDEMVTLVPGTETVVSVAFIELDIRKVPKPKAKLAKAW